MAFPLLINMPKWHILFDKICHFLYINSVKLKDIRTKANITQLEASNIVGVPLRTFIRYENEEKYKKTLKYQKICDVLEQTFRIDEEHGILSIEEIKNITKKVFDKHDVEFAFLFGSYAKGKASPKSDIDILIISDITGIDYFGLVEELRESLHKKIDLIRLKDIEPNSEIMIEILKVCKIIYGQRKK